MEEIQQRYEPETKKGEGLSRIAGEESAIPTDPQKVVEAFPLWLGRAAARGRFILILDALNQLEDRDNAPDLGWLPWSFSSNVRLIVSTLPGRSLNALKKRNWLEINIRLMEKTAQEEYIIQYLKQYRKELNPAQRKRIIKEEQASNPLYLRTLLEELRVFGIFEELDNKIEHYLEARTIDGLFSLVLERMEKDYERERKGLVKDVTTLIWASRRGLSETEILELMGSKETPMPRALFSPLYLALEESLVSRAGLLTFFHDFLKKAVESRYLSDPDLIQKAHLTIADYFDHRDIDDRKVDELPWQLRRAENWPRLKDCVTDMDMFLKLRTEEKQYELTGYWLAMGQQYDMVDGYNEMIARYDGASPDLSELANRLNEASVFLYINARFDGAEPLYRRALAIRKKVLGPDHPNTAQGLNNMAALLYAKGDYDGAEPLYRRALAIWEKVLGPDHPNTAHALFNLAILYRNKGEHEKALPLYHLLITTFEEEAAGKKIPQQTVGMRASCHNNIAFHTEVPTKNWNDAEYHYRHSIDLFNSIPNPLEASNVKLNLQTLFWLAGKEVDMEMVKEITKALDDAGDPRALKGHKLIESISR